jgi:hypothetical protein
MRSLLLILAPLLLTSHVDPPYSGTVWISPDIITSSDPTAYSGLTYTGRGLRTIYDRRPPGWVQVDAYLFEVAFDDGTTSEFIVNPEFGSADAAEAFVANYGPPIGRLSTSMRKDMREVWINGGDAAAGGGNNSILLHTVYADRHLADGFLEEVLVHEAGHTSFDAEHAQSQGWLEAQAADPDFISTYARDNPFREDISESLLPYYALRYRPDRMSQADLDRIGQAIPNRIAYFDALDLDWYPMVTGTGVEPETPTLSDLAPPYPNPFSGRTSITVQMPRPGELTVSVYDLLGRKVVQLSGEAQSAGTHELTWNGTDGTGTAVGSGMYIVFVETPGVQGRVRTRTSQTVHLVR